MRTAKKCCSRCRLLKLLTDFTKHKARSDGHASICRTCRSEYRKEKEAYNYSGYLKSIRHRYGISQETYELMLLEQGFVCACCGRGFGHLRPHVDHCHDTGKVRGLLCRGCNHGLGNFQDDIDRLDAAMEYLAKHSPEARYGSDLWEYSIGD